MCTPKQGWASLWAGRVCGVGTLHAVAARWSQGEEKGHTLKSRAGRGPKMGGPKEADSDPSSLGEVLKTPLLQAKPGEISDLLSPALGTLGD